MSYEMEQITCPIDGQPCAHDCPDRYTDREKGGCFLTTAQEFGISVLTIGDTGAMVFIIGSDGVFL